jgi:hypothetical protein
MKICHRPNCKLPRRSLGMRIIYEGQPPTNEHGHWTRKEVRQRWWRRRSPSIHRWSPAVIGAVGILMGALLAALR